MDFDYSAEEEAFRQEVRAFLDEHLPEDDSPAATAKWNEALIEKNWIGFAWPKDEGGGGGPFMGLRMLQSQTMWGDKMREEVEDEIERLVNNSYIIAKRILQENKDLFEHLTKVLLEQEVVSAEEFQMMLVEFKAKTIDYKIIGEERNREKLPFKLLPNAV